MVKNYHVDNVIIEGILGWIRLEQIRSLEEIVNYDFHDYNEFYESM